MVSFSLISSKALNYSHDGKENQKTVLLYQRSERDYAVEAVRSPILGDGASHASSQKESSWEPQLPSVRH